MKIKIVQKFAIIAGIISLLLSSKISLAENTTQQKSEESNIISTNSSRKTNQAPKALIKIQKGEINGKIPFSLNLDGSESSDPEKGKLTYQWQYPNEEIITSKNPRSYRFKEAGNFEISLTVTDPEGLSDTASLQIEAKEKAKKTKSVSTKTKSSKIPKKSKFQNGDPSTTIFINEIFPNPKGKDSDKEWLELYNHGNHNINLGNWKISQTKLNSETAKPKITTLSDELIIESGGYLILNNSQLKSLANQENKIELLDYNDKIIDSIIYEKSKEDLSLSKITIKNPESPNSSKQILNWVEASKNSANPIFYQIRGTITKTETDFLVLQTKSGKEIKIHNPTSQLNQTLLSENTEILTLVEKSDCKFRLKNYKILKAKPILDPKKSPGQTDSWLINLFKISCLILLIVFFIKLTKRRIKKHGKKI